MIYTEEQLKELTKKANSGFRNIGQDKIIFSKEGYIYLINHFNNIYLYHICQPGILYQNMRDKWIFEKSYFMGKPVYHYLTSETLKSEVCNSCKEILSKKAITFYNLLKLKEKIK